MKTQHVPGTLDKNRNAPPLPSKRRVSRNGAGSPQVNVSLLLRAVLAARAGDFSVRLPSNWTGVEGKLADTFNEMMVTNATMEKELRRVSRTVGKEGKIRQRAAFSLGNGGAWRGMEESVNNLIGD